MVDKKATGSSILEMKIKNKRETGRKKLYCRKKAGDRRWNTRRFFYAKKQ